MTRLLCALLSLSQTVALYRALFTPSELLPLLRLPPALDAVTSGLWAIAFGVLAVGLWGDLTPPVRTVRRWRAWMALCGFALYGTVRLALFAAADYDQGRLPLMVALSVGLIIVLLGLWVRRPRPSA
jgi:hypothetical protein